MEKLKSMKDFFVHDVMVLIRVMILFFFISPRNLVPLQKPHLWSMLLMNELIRHVFYLQWVKLQCQLKSERSTESYPKSIRNATKSRFLMHIHKYVTYGLFFRHHEACYISQT